MTDIAHVTELPVVSEDEVYAAIQVDYPNFPVGFSPAIAMQMLWQMQETLARAAAERKAKEEIVH